MAADKERSIEALSIRQMIKELTELRKKVSGMEELGKELLTARNLLTESEKRFFYIVENVPDIIYVLDSYGNIRFISNSIIRYGYSPEELIGISILTLVHPEDHARATYRINERRTGSRSTRFLELRLVKRNQGAVQMEINDKPIAESLVFSISAEGRYKQSGETGPAFMGTLGVARDLSQRNESPAVMGDRIPFEAVESVLKESLLKIPNHIPATENNVIAICSSCKSIRDRGIWESVEEYFHANYNASFTHTICPVCMNVLYKDLNSGNRI